MTKPITLHMPPAPNTTTFIDCNTHTTYRMEDKKPKPQKPAPVEDMLEPRENVSVLGFMRHVNDR